MQHFSKKCCIFYLIVTISDINSNTLHLIATYLKIIFALYWLYLPFLTTTSHKNPYSQTKNATFLRELLHLYKHGNSLNQVHGGIHNA